MTDFADANIVGAQTERVTGHDLSAWIAEARALLKLAGPLIVTQLAQMAIMTTDVIMLGRLGKTSLAAAALGNTVFFFTWLVGCGPVAAVAPLIAHILGGHPNNRAGVRAVVRMGFWSVGLLALPLIGVLLLTRPILIALGQQPDLATLAGAFTRALCLGLPFSLGYQVLRNFATALGRPRSALTVMAIAIAFNFVGDYALIFGHFGMPKLGIVGSGVASACSFAFQFFAMWAVVSLTPKLRLHRVFRRFHRPDWTKLAEVFRLGMPIGLTMIFEAMMFNAATLLMGHFGTAAIAGNQVATNVASLTFMVPLGLAMAATVRVGLSAGAGDREGVRRAGYTAMMVSVLCMGTFGLIFLAFPQVIADAYFASNARANADAVALTVKFLGVAAAFQIFDGLQVVGALSLRGLKDARAPMWIAAASYWLVGFPACLLFGFGLHMEGVGIWIGLAFGLLVAAAAMGARFYYLSREPVGKFALAG
ncbi:MAG TPA: MATE family efflux transporter [Rhizomicrobium sp.]